MAKRNHDAQVSPKGGGRNGYTVKQDRQIISEYNKQSAAIAAGKREAVKR